MMQRAKEKRVLETLVMGKPDLKQSDLDDILRYGTLDLFEEDDDDDDADDAVAAATGAASVL